MGPDRLLTPNGLPAFQVLDSTVPPGGASAGAVVDPVPTAHLLLIREGGPVHRAHRRHPVPAATRDSLAFASPPAYAWRNEGTELDPADRVPGSAAALLTSHSPRA